MGAPDAVVKALEANFDRSLEELVALSRIPGVSAEGYDPVEVERSAEAVAALLRDAGLSDVELLRVDGAHPYVTAQWLGAGVAAPTVLLYAHHDVQPPGRPERWRTPPFEPSLAADGRLYGRGVVDDKAGVIAHVAALRAWLDATGALPVNVKLLVEGEEEIGSEHLESFLRAHRDRLQADVIVLSDTANLEAGLPSITTSLRGMLAIDVQVRALDHPLHSGLWGGALPDAGSALAILLGRLFDSQGCVAIPGLEDDLPELSSEVRARLEALPFDEARFRSDAGAADGLRLSGDAHQSVYERLWRRPAVSVTAIESVPLAEAANQLLSEAQARIGVRLAPGQDPLRVRELIEAFLLRDPPWGVEVETTQGAAAPGWACEPDGPAFDAAKRALIAGYGREPVFIGCGGTIPFVGPFAKVLGGVPALLSRTRRSHLQRTRREREPSPGRLPLIAACDDAPARGTLASARVSLSRSAEPLLTAQSSR